MTRGNAIALALGAAVLLILPWIIGNEFYVNMATQVLIYALFALSINMMLGFGGMVSLGHAGYLGIAGYACILATIAGYNQLTAAIFAIALSTASAAFFGVLSLRAPGLGFIMITLALGQIVWGIAYRANDLTGGDNGIRHPARPMPFGFDIRDAPSFYYFTLIVVILGGAGSLMGAFVGSFIVGFLYNFGIALAPDLAYFVLFLPMVLVLVFLPQGLFGRAQI